MTVQNSQSSKPAKVLLALILATSLLAGTPLPAYAATNSLSISINGQTQSYPQPPMMIEDRVYIPVRALFESLGYKVDWAEHWNSINAYTAQKSLTINLDKKDIHYHDPLMYRESKDVPIKIIEGRSMIPVRFVSEMLGLEVRWDAAHHHVQILSEKTALFDALMSRDRQKVRTLLEQGADPNINRDTPSALEYAVAMRDMLSAQLLVEKGAVISGEVLMTAILLNDAELLKWLITSSKLAETNAELASELLSTSIRHYNVESAKVLLDLGTDPNRRDQTGDSPLHSAIHNRNTETTRDLLSAGADPNTFGYQQNPLLITAVDHGTEDIINLLLTHKANPNAATPEGWTPLMVAAEHGNIPVIRILLANGADLHTVNKHGGTALAIAQAHGNTDTADMLIEAGAKAIPFTKLPKAALIRTDAQDPSKTPLMVAAIRGETHRVKQLLSGKPSPISADDWTESLISAITVGNVETTKALLVGYPDQDFFNLWDYVGTKGNDEIRRILVEHDQTTSIGPQQNLMNMLADRSLNLGLYQIQLEAGYPADQPLHLLGETPLFRMVDLGYPEAIRLLLKHGADPNRTHYTPTGPETMVETAVSAGHPESLKVLLTSDKVTQETKNLALLAAVKRGSLDMATRLLDAGADAHFQDSNGDSPIELAKQSGSTQLIELLK